MTIDVTCAETNLTLKADSNTFFFDRLGSNETLKLPLTFSASAGIQEGRYDIQLKPVKKGLPGIIIELKAEKNGTEESLKQLSETALKQIQEKQYDTELRAAGVEVIYKYGVAFCGKRVEVAVG